jgi:hypothetical protein
VKRLVFTGVLLLAVVCFCQGCALALAGIITDHEMTKSDYDSYVKDTRKDNTDREEHGLKPNPIMSFQDWKRGAAQPVNGEPLPPEPVQTNSINHPAR